MEKPDGLYDFIELQDELSEDFKKEKDLVKFIEDNIVNFTNDLGFTYLSHAKEFPLQPFKKRHKGSKRIDLIINTKCGLRLGIECKRPKYKCELVSGLGQVLSYITMCETQGIRVDKFYIVSSKTDLITALTIARFNLPIGFIAMDKTKAITWVGRKKN